VTCQDVREDAAVAILTRAPIPPTVNSHLRDCPGCQDEITPLLPLPGLLAAVSEEELAAVELPDEHLLARMLSAADEIRARRRRTHLLVAAAAVVALALPAGVLIYQGGTPRNDSPSVEADRGGVEPVTVKRSAKSPATGVFGKVWLTPASWGSDLTFAIRGVPAGEQCSLVVVSRGGARESAARWRADYRGTARVSGAVSAAVPDIERIDVVAGDGNVLLRVPVGSVD